MQLNRYINIKLLVFIILTIQSTFAQSAISFRLGLFAHPNHPNQYYIDFERGPEPIYEHGRKNVSCEEWQPNIQKDSNTGECFIVVITDIKVFYKYRLCELKTDSENIPLWIDHSRPGPIDKNNNQVFPYISATGESSSSVVYGTCKLIADNIFFYLNKETMARIFELDDFMAPVIFLGSIAGLRHLVVAPVVGFADKALKVYKIWRKGKYAFELLLTPAFYFVAEDISCEVIPDWTMDDSLDQRFFNDCANQNYQGNTKHYTDIDVVTGSEEIFNSTGKLILAEDEDIVDIAKKIKRYIHPDTLEKAPGIRIVNPNDALPPESCGQHAELYYRSNIYTVIDDCFYYSYRFAKNYVNTTIASIPQSIKWSMPVSPTLFLF